MIKVVPYNETIGSERFKEFLTKTFVVDMLCLVSEKSSVTTLFDGWRGKNMINWFRFTNQDGLVLEFYPEGTYIIKPKKGKPNQLKTPKTIDEFIDDMIRFDVPIYWNDWVDENFEPKDYMRFDEIKPYFTDLLNRMGKGHELL